MGNEVKVADFIFKQKERFIKLNKANGDLLSFEQECLFAKQQIMKNDHTYKIASGNPSSLQAAILNISAIGISLNPATAHAYLVPRGGAICLDISYRGLVKLATDAGAIQWAKAELVYDKDVFAWKGPCNAPDHTADPFSERGELKGGYCIAKLSTGEIMTEVMPVSEIYKIRDTSKAKSGPWSDWFEEMAKKTIIKRASKSWPQGNSQRLSTAIDVLNEQEGIAYTIDEHIKYMELLRTENALGFFEFKQAVSEEAWNALYNSFDKGQKVENKKKAADLERKGVEMFNAVILDVEALIDSDDENGAIELKQSISQAVWSMVVDRLKPESFHKLKQWENLCAA